jgi:hypothetical protein
MQFDEDGLRNFKDFLTVYNQMSELCFNRCVLNLNSRYKSLLCSMKFQQCCGSGMFTPDPGSNNSIKREGAKKFLSYHFLATKNQKIVNKLIFELVNKSFKAKKLSTIVLLTLKFVCSYQKYGLGIRDLGSGKNLFRIADPGSKRHRIPDPQH